MGYHHEIPDYTVRKCKFGPEDEAALVTYLQDEHTAALHDRSSLEKKWREWVKHGESVEEQMRRVVDRQKIIPISSISLL